MVGRPNLRSQTMSKRVIKWSDARLFCNLVASTADTVVTWQVFDDSPAKDHTKARSLRGSLSDKKFRDRLQAANEAGCGIYITANTCDDTGKRRAENVTGYTASFIDLDGAPLPDAPAVAFDIILETSPASFIVGGCCRRAPTLRYGRTHRRGLPRSMVATRWCMMRPAWPVAPAFGT